MAKVELEKRRGGGKRAVFCGDRNTRGEGKKKKEIQATLNEPKDPQLEVKK